jgi:integrase
MSILSQCPVCRRKQANKNRNCINCRNDLVKSKRSKKVRYWISYRMPDGRQRRESVSAFKNLNGYSIEDARIALSKRQLQKREKRILDMLPESTITFKELSDWYLKLPKIKKLASYRSKKVYLNKFNEVFGDKVVGEITVDDLEAHQASRKDQGWQPASIDQEIGHAKAAVTIAFFRGKDKKTKQPLIDGNVLREFKALDNTLIRGANARKRTITFDEYLRLLDSAPAHFRAVLIVAFNTGMRSGELQKLQWKHIDREEMFIRLPEGYTKNGDARDIPINHFVKTVLDTLPRAIAHDYVFTFKGRPLTHKNGFVNQMKDACKNSGVPYGRKAENGVTMHDLRRTAKTNMLNAGVPKEYRDMVLGHSLEGMDKHYLSPSEDDLKREMARFTNWLDEQLEKVNVDPSVDQKISN